MIDGDKTSRHRPALQRRSLECRISDSFDSPLVNRDEWDAFVSSVSGDIYMTFDWCRVWWQHYGAGRRLRVLIYTAEQKIVGIVPLFVDTIWIGPIWLRVAKIVGGDYSLQICDPPVAKEWADSIFRQLADWVFSEERCDAVHVGPVPSVSMSREAMRNACLLAPAPRPLLRDRAADVGTVFILPESFEGYLASLDRKRRSFLKKSSALFRQSFSSGSDVVCEHGEVATEFLRFSDLHRRQWENEGKLGHFGDWPRSEEFNRDLARSHGSLGRFRLYRLLADGEPVSLQYCFVFGGTNYWRLPARIVSDDLDRLSLGQLGLMQMIESCIQEGVTRMEAGQGHYAYKLHLGGREYQLHSLVAVAPRLGVRIRSGLFFALSYTLNLFYYRIWFIRVAPRVKWLQRPLWRVWIRSRM